MRFSTTIFEVFLPKSSLDVGTSLALSASLTNEAPTTYYVGSDITEASSAVVTATIKSSTSDGDLPQQQCVIESRGGGDVGQTVIPPGVQVQVNVATSGAAVDAGFTGSSNSGA